MVFPSVRLAQSSYSMAACMASPLSRFKVVSMAEPSSLLETRLNRFKAFIALEVSTMTWGLFNASKLFSILFRVFTASPVSTVTGISISSTPMFAKTAFSWFSALRWVSASFIFSCAHPRADFTPAILTTVAKMPFSLLPKESAALAPSRTLPLN